MEEYYMQQAGSGISPFEGIRFQRGHGIFSNFIKGKLFPILKSVLPYLGRTAFDTGMDIARNLNDGENFKTAAKKVFKRKAFDVADDAIGAIKKQAGLGMKHPSLVSVSLRRLSAKRKKCIKVKRTPKELTLF